MSTCACDTGRDYDDCCGPYHAGDRDPPDALALMRARYAAFARGRLGFIESTLHSRARAKHDPEQTRKWSLESEWQGLEIVSTEAGTPADSKGFVEFIARFKSGGEEVEHHELAEFRREDDTWRFWDGKLLGDEPIRREAPKVGRNDPCPCGSGKKHKKCCGK